MMTDEEKHLLAKQRYQEFHRRMNEKLAREPAGNVRAYITLSDNSVVEDYHWSDHEITPTSLYRWIRTYNNPTVKKDSRAVQVMIRGRDYERVKSMYADFTEPLIVNDVLVIPNKADF